MLPSEELVRDDIVEFTSGEQICADAVVCTGSAQANEALITGEAEPVPKNVGDVLRSGSFLVSGRCTVRLTHVGAESYASKLATEAREGGHKVAKGEMMRSLDGLIRVIGIALIPMGVVMFLKQYVSLELPLRDSVEATVAALIGMIPEGLYLLTSVALAVSMVRLAQRKVLAQDMNCIETLARVDVLCVDKTGTITEARMEAGEPLLLTPDAWPQDRVYTVLHSIYAGTEPDNDTARAMVQRFGKQNGTPWPRQSVVPFNSAYKWSAATFAEGRFVVGAPEFVAGARYAELAAQVEPLLEKAAACCCWLAVMLSRTPRSGWMLTSWSLWPCCPLPTASDQKHRKRSATLPNRALPLRSSPAIIPLPSARWPARRALRAQSVMWTPQRWIPTKKLPKLCAPARCLAV